MQTMRSASLAAITTVLVLACGGAVETDENDAAEEGDAAPDETSDGVEDPAPDGTEDPVSDVPYPEECIMVIVEAEDFTLNEYWAACPGAGCEDDRSANASGGGHLITFEDHTTPDPAGYISITVDLPRAGTWYVWARAARAGDRRQWDFAYDGTVSDTPIGGADTTWVLGGTFELTRTSGELVIRDASPDMYWAYPDVFLFAVSADLDPNLCATDGFEATGCLCD